VRKRLADGTLRIYHYAWRGGPQVVGKPGSPEFLTSYQAAHQSRRPTPQNLIRGLIAEFQASAEFRELSAKTRQDYGRYLSLIGNEFGDMPLAAVEDRRARGEFKSWRDRLKASPRTADYAWSVLARLFSWAKDRGRIINNPCERGGRSYRADRSEKIWTEAEIGSFLAVASPPLRLALLLALWTGQRQGDLLRLPWSAFDGSTMRLRQSKTRRRVSIKAGEPLRAALSQTARTATTILTNTAGHSWTEDGFRTSWGKACRKAGIVGLHFHDLRGSAVTRLAEAGCTEAEIAAITGHSLRQVGSMLDRYLNRSEKLAEAAILKLERGTNRDEKL
jgi:integrase